jgi:hypothetical protein
MTEAIATLVGRVGFAAIAGIGLGLIFGQSWWVGIGATLVFSSFPECLGFASPPLGPDMTESYEDIGAELERIGKAYSDDDIIT